MFVTNLKAAQRCEVFVQSSFKKAIQNSKIFDYEKIEGKSAIDKDFIVWGSIRNPSAATKKIYGEKSNDPRTRLHLIYLYRPETQEVSLLSFGPHVTAVTTAKRFTNKLYIATFDPGNLDLHKSKPAIFRNKAKIHQVEAVAEYEIPSLGQPLGEATSVLYEKNLTTEARTKEEIKRGQIVEMKPRDGMKLLLDIRRKNDRKGIFPESILR